MGFVCGGSGAGDASLFISQISSIFKCCEISPDAGFTTDCFGCWCFILFILLETEKLKREKKCEKKLNSVIILVILHCCESKGPRFAKKNKS